MRARPDCRRHNAATIRHILGHPAVSYNGAPRRLAATPCCWRKCPVSVCNFRASERIIAAAFALLVSSVQAGEDTGRSQTLDTVVVTAQRFQAQLEAERVLTPGAVTTLDASTFNERSVTQ